MSAAEHEEMAAWSAMRRADWIAACEADVLAGVEADAAPALPWEGDYE